MKGIPLLLTLWLTATPSAYAVHVTFEGSLVESLPCVVNEGHLIEVDFGNNLVIRNLDGVRYRESIHYQLACSGLGTVKLSVQGNPVSFDNAAVQTDKTGLGIRLELAGNAFALNTAVVVDPVNPPALTAVPIANPVQLPGPGAFTARATLLAEYE
ncbi:fimbrial protein [Klebsiella oxytoca]|uniref:fimbrial protein n=1 Tax=Klebsiella oxytoca TaxID=571 RepID=UPI00157AC84D|nr:fimbrial protein [Klebsiella oxytoca]